MRVSRLSATLVCCLGIVVGMLIVDVNKLVRDGRNVLAASTYNPKQPDPCVLNIRVSVPINLTASGQVITGTAGKQTYICSMMLDNATAQNVALVEGTGAVCGTNTVGMAGGATAATGFNMGATQAIWLANPGWWSMATISTGDNVCLLLSGTTQLSGFIQYSQN